MDLPPIPSKLFFTIGEACDLVGVPAHVLRYWEKETGDLLVPTRRSGRRYYSNADILVARRIRTLLHEGMTLSGVVRQLSRRSSENPSTGKPDSELVKYLSEQLQEIITELKAAERPEN